MTYAILHVWEGEEVKSFKLSTQRDQSLRGKCEKSVTQPSRADFDQLEN